MIVIDSYLCVVEQPYASFCGSRVGVIMGRPSLSLGTAGQVRTYRTDNGWQARTKVRDYDGIVREVQRHGATDGAARRALAEALRDRVFKASGPALTPESRVSVLAEQWFASLDGQGKAQRTIEQYRYALDRLILKGVGALRIRELTVGSCDRFLLSIHSAKGASTARMARSVLSNMCAFAARMDLLDRNPVRDTSAISRKPKHEARALTVAQALDLMAALSYDDQAIRRDLPDLIAFMLGTGLRISEASAVRWRDLDLTALKVSVRGNIVRITGKGLIRQTDESSKLKPRTLVLPSWAVKMLTERHKPGTSPNDPVFPAPKGGYRDPSNSQADLRKAFDNAGYGWAVSHTFRRTVASLMDEDGRTARAIADQLGHSRTSQSQDKYIARRATSDAAEVLEALA
jgi:integrase